MQTENEALLSAATNALYFRVIGESERSESERYRGERHNSQSLRDHRCSVNSTPHGVGCAYIHLHSLFWHQFPDRFLPFFSQIQMWNKPKSVPKAADENLV